jgi:hypothetical protein
LELKCPLKTFIYFQFVKCSTVFGDFIEPNQRAQRQSVYDIQHNDTQHNDTQHNDIQHNDIQHNSTQHNDT